MGPASVRAAITLFDYFALGLVMARPFEAKLAANSLKP
jgi:hypothetical protein